MIQSQWHYRNDNFAVVNLQELQSDVREGGDDYHLVVVSSSFTPGRGTGDRNRF